MTEETNVSTPETSAPEAVETPAVQQETSSTASPDFRAQLPEQYRELYPEFKKPEDFVKGYDELVRKLGSSISLPKDDSPAEEWEKVYSKLGRPESPDKYEFEIKDEEIIHKDFFEGFKKTAHENGFTQKQAKQMLDWYNGEVQKIQSVQQQEAEAEYAKAEAQLKVKWGRDYESKLEEVRGFAKKVAGDEGFAKLEKYGNDPDFVSLLATIKERFVKEDRMVAQAATSSGTLDLKAEARQLMSEPDYSRNEAKQAKVRDLFQRYANQIGANK